MSSCLVLCAFCMADNRKVTKIDCLKNKNPDIWSFSDVKPRVFKNTQQILCCHHLQNANEAKIVLNVCFKKKQQKKQLL